MPSGVNIKLLSKTEILVSLSDENKPASEIKLGSSDIEQLIALLATMREQLNPEVLRQPPEGNLTGPSDPIYAIYDVTVLPGKYMSIRHPGIGWLSFLFPKADAQKLGRALLQGGRPGMSSPPTQTGPRH